MLNFSSVLSINVQFITMEQKVVLILLLFIKISHGFSSYSFKDILNDVTPAHELRPMESFSCCPEEHNRGYPMIFCYKAAKKRIENIWMSSEVTVSLNQDQFDLYWGYNEVEVIEMFMEDRSLLRFSFFYWRPKDIKLNPFNDTCFGILTSHDYNLTLKLDQYTTVKQWTFIGGLTLFFAASTLAPDPIFFYVTGVVVGVLLSVLVLFYWLLLFLPLKKPALAALVMGGSGIMMYMMDWIINLLVTFIAMNQTLVLVYIIVSSVVSFFICYRYGPLTNNQSINIFKWTLQAAGMGAVWSSTHYKEAINSIIAVTVFLYYVPVIQMSYHTYLVVFRATLWLLKTLLTIIVCWIAMPVIMFFYESFLICRTAFWLYWYNNMPELRFLTQQEYRDQGRQETDRALTALRDAFHTHQVNPYKTLLQLSPQARERMILYLAQTESHVTLEECVQHSFEYNIPEDED